MFTTKNHFFWSLLDLLRNHYGTTTGFGSEQEENNLGNMMMAEGDSVPNGGINNPAFLDDADENIQDEEVKKSPILQGYRERKKTKEALHSSRDQRRATFLKRCREILKQEVPVDGKFSHIDSIFQNREFTDALFNVFDCDGSGTITQQDFFDTLKVNFRGPQFDHKSREYKNDVLDLIGTVAYFVCRDKDLTPENFHELLNSRGVAPRLYNLADYDGSGDMDVEELMNFIIALTKPLHSSEFDADQVKNLQELFRKSLPPGQDQLTMKEFKKLLPAKNPFFVERAFKIFDQDGNGLISITEFFDAMNAFASQGPTEKIIFLFKIYDIDGDGTLQLEELASIIRASLTESGMRLPESDVQNLAYALYEDALGDEDEDTGSITIDQLTAVFAKHEGLIDGLNFSMAQWLSPPKKTKKKSWTDPIKKYFGEKFSLNHLRNNWQLYTFMLIFVYGINIILFITRAYYFRNFSFLNGYKPNWFYMFSRACGRCLLYTSMMILVLVLRYTITKMRNMGMSAILPLDNNIYIHKVLGIFAFIFAWVHTVMHILNFSINVAPNPIKFVQLTNDYWSHPNAYLEDYEQKLPNWAYLGYNLPDKCRLEFDPDKCPPELIDRTLNATACQICEDGGSYWNAGDWIFTMKPGVFGLIGGIANPTGVALQIIFTVMFICSMPFVRKTGHFQVFYFTHLMYWAYWVLLILHAPEFWKWVVAPLVIYVIERVYRGFSTLIGQGKSTILEGKVLASRVTNLVVKRPHNFNYNPGDWVFVRIPKIAKYEWHPFTISSAPERTDAITLHVRGVGQWTNRLYKYYEEENKKQSAESRRQSMKMRAQKSIKRQSTKQSRDETALDIEAGDFKKNRLEIHLDGPFGAPASNIFRQEHAVLIATGIGVTPFSSILQSIMARYFVSKRECPRCHYRWSDTMGTSMLNLKKVDFFWINRDQNSFEWFSKLLNEIELEQIEDQQVEDHDCVFDKFMDIHMYFTAALQKTDMKAVGLQVALDLLHKKDKRDLVTGLKARTNAGRPHWNRVFSKIRDEKKGKVTVFYCGNPVLARILREKCEEFGFDFRKEVF